MSGPVPPYDWDQDKADANVKKHGVAFTAVYQFDWATAIEAEDTRFDYAETRMQALGKIGDRYHVLVYAKRDTTIRIISLLKAKRGKSHERPTKTTAGF